MFQKLKNIYHLFVAVYANILYGFPGKKLKVIGVTGTDGKTTTTSLIYHVLKQNGEKVSMLTSVSAKIESKEYDTGFHVTTPSPIQLQRLLSEAVKAGSEYFVLEVTSHAIDQYRIWGIPFKFGVLTNITPEHLDYHKTFENYVKTKEKLLITSEIAIVNRDDKSFEMLSRLKKAKDSSNLLTYGFSREASMNLDKIRIESEVLIGDFNKLNALAAALVCLKTGIDQAKIEKFIESFKMPTGRMDFVYKKDFKILIDFAHTPNAFEKLLSSLESLTSGRIIHVFGSAGERDKSKRPEMGKISSRYSDIIILTAEDPRSEKVANIISNIADGVEGKSEVLKIEDRREAIRKSIEIAKKGDIVVITGKAHEKSMTYGKVETPWDEYEEVEKALKEVNGK
jgi:UDP-N-acetylmuramoyl-L-alanyl-D-glutamate--2,6-diaminopimelate ligase